MWRSDWCHFYPWGFTLLSAHVLPVSGWILSGFFSFFSQSNDMLTSVIDVRAAFLSRLKEIFNWPFLPLNIKAVRLGNMWDLCIPSLMFTQDMGTGQVVCLISGWCLSLIHLHLQAAGGDACLRDYCEVFVWTWSNVVFGLKDQARNICRGWHLITTLYMNHVHLFCFCKVYIFLDFWNKNQCYFHGERLLHRKKDTFTCSTKNKEGVRIKLQSISVWRFIAKNRDYFHNSLNAKVQNFSYLLTWEEDSLWDPMISKTSRDRKPERISVFTQVLCLRLCWMVPDVINTYD